MKKKYTKSKQAAQVEPKMVSSKNSNAITIWTQYIKYNTLASEKHSEIMSISNVRSIGNEVYKAYANLNMCAQVVYILLAVLFICTKDYVDIYIDQSFVRTALFCLLMMSMIFWVIRFISVILYKKFTERCDSYLAECKKSYAAITEEYMKE